MVRAQLRRQQPAASSQQQGLLTIQQQRGTLHPQVADRAAFTLARQPRPDAAIIGQWVPVLLAPGSTAGSGALSMLVSGSRWPEDKDSALLLLEHLLAPRQTLTPRLSFTGDERAVDSIISGLTGEDYALRQAWEQFFRPHLDELAGPVAAIASRHLQTAHLILCSAGRASDRWDYTSFDRSGIEPHHQDSPSQPFDLLIDVARDCLAALVRHTPDHAAGVITSWAVSTVPLLRRLAVYGYTHRTDISADEKLRWAISRRLLYDITVKHELFLLVEAALPAASAATRDELLQEITSGPPDDELADVSDESRAYVIYNLLHWVVSKAPDFTQAQESLAELAAQHASFKPREHPDLDLVFSGGATGPHSPVTVHQVLEMTTSQDVDWMLTYEGEPLPGTWIDRFGLLSVIGEAAAASPGWAAKIAEQLNTKQNWETDLWPVLMNGWWLSAATVEAEQATAIISQLDRHQSPYGIILSVIRLLEALAKRQDFPPAVHDEIEEYALKLRDIGLAGDSADGEPRTADLGTIAGAAVNHWAGRLVSFWATALNFRDLRLLSGDLTGRW